MDGRRKGRLKLTWIGSVNVDLREKRLSGEETLCGGNLSETSTPYKSRKRSGRKRSGYAIYVVEPFADASFHVALVLNRMVEPVPERLTSNCWTCVATLSRLWKEGRCDGWNTANT